jgi:hypothetical protein
MVPDPIRDQEIREWRLDQVDRCLASQQHMPAGIKPFGQSLLVTRTGPSIPSA